MLAEIRQVATEARKTAGLRQIDIATAAGVGHETISAFEADRRTPNRLEAIVAAYESECGLRQDELYERALARRRERR